MEDGKNGKIDGNKQSESESDDSSDDDSSEDEEMESGRNGKIDEKKAGKENPYERDSDSDSDKGDSDSESESGSEEESNMKWKSNLITKAAEAFKSRAGRKLNIMEIVYGTSSTHQDEGVKT